MICLTADIHHMSLNTGNQQHSDIPELTTALHMAHRLREANVKATFFFTGKCFDEEWDGVKPLCEFDNIEFGGHTYSGFTPELFHRACKKLVGSYNGPRWYQRWDTLRTIRTIQQHTGRRITSWRNHMYMHGPHTDSVLAECGIRICSDGVKAGQFFPAVHPQGLLNCPINVIPDHEHIIHAERTPEWIERWQKRYNWRDDFGSESYPVETWADIVIAQIRAHQQAGRLSVILIHPITMYLADRFASFERILTEIARYPTITLNDVADCMQLQGVKHHE